MTENTVELPEVTVYSRPNCPQCVQTKRYLDREGIAFTEVSAIDHKAELNLYGFQTAPVVAVGSLDNAWTGFRPDRLKELL